MTYRWDDRRGLGGYSDNACPLLCFRICFPSIRSALIDQVKGLQVSTFIGSRE